MKRFAIPLCLFLTVVAAYAPPTWWSQGSTNIFVAGAAANNYGPVNLGQLKHVATQAKKHLDVALPASGGAGPEVNAMVAAFTNDPGTPTAPGTNFSPVNLGQLKAVAKPFYDRLIAIGYDTKANLTAHRSPSDPNPWPNNYPWDNDNRVNVSENYVPANLGQLKFVFSFEVLDSDGDGIPDFWEIDTG